MDALKVSHKMISHFAVSPQADIKALVMDLTVNASEVTRCDVP